MTKFKPWSVNILTLFPEMFPGFLSYSLAGKALEKGLWSLNTLNIRSFAKDKHGTVDDSPFGGGAGMVMRPDVIEAALRSVNITHNFCHSERSEESFIQVEDPSAYQPQDDNQKARKKHRLVYLTPRGKLLNQEIVKNLVTTPEITILCGRYEGVDERVLQAYQMEEISVGDFVLSGGEPAALVLLDACIRLLPGVMGNEETAGEESFESGLLEYPHYTRPAEWIDQQGQRWDVPEILLSGHHEKVKKWRHEQAEKTTAERREDLWQKYLLTQKDKKK